MPFVTADQARLFYRFEGNAGSPVLVLSHSIGTDHGMWEPQVRELLPHFHVLRYDTRGHGASDAPKGEYSIEQLGRDVLALADILKVQKFAFCGLSLGGAIGQWLAIHAPDRLTAVVLANTSPRFGTPENWKTRIDAVRQGGMAAIVDLAMQRFFSPESVARNEPYAASIRSILLGTDGAGYMGCCAALRDFDFTQNLRNIKTPTLVIAGDKDVSTPWPGNGEILAREISGARAVRLPAAHLSNLERPKSFNAALFAFLRPSASSQETLQAGFEVRRKILGDAHVDRAIAATSEFTEEFQALITRYAWGTIWTRPGLDERTRRLLVLVTTAALGRWEEFRLHISAGLAHDLEPCDIKEALLQTAVYAGVPAANTGFHIAQEEMDKQRPGQAASD
ncbi:MAG: 3-oxoadipate enol-lactonase [Candidatus Sulfotelmatobacter sp.]